MSTQKYTPKPWIYEGGCVYSKESGRIALADRENPGTSPAERDRNMELCAAAPEMLEALAAAKEALQHHGHYGDPAVFMADAAIAKATGA